MLYDSINYLTTTRDLVNCLNGVYEVLKPGGVFIFDITTEFNSLNYFENEVQIEERSDCFIIRCSSYSESAKYQDNRFIMFIRQDDNGYRRLEEFHRQRIYSEREMKEIIDESDFNLLGSYDNFTFKSPGRKSERIHYILQK